MTYLKRFQALAKELEKHPYFEIVELRVNPPITARALKDVEKVLGATLAEPVRGFYQEADGLYLRWRFKLDLPVEDSRRLRKVCDDYQIAIAEPESEAFARINLISLHESFTKSWEELSVGHGPAQVQFMDQSYERAEFQGRLKPFDLFDREQCMAFVVEEGQGDPKVMLLSDGYCDWENSRITDFSSYMEFLLATRGIVEARESVFAEPRGDQKAPLVGAAPFWKKRTPKLFGPQAAGAGRAPH